MAPPDRLWPDTPFRQRDHVRSEIAGRFDEELLFTEYASDDVRQRGRYVWLVVGAEARELSAQAELHTVAQARQVGSGDHYPPAWRDQPGGCAQRAPGSLEMLYHLHQQDAIRARQVIGVLGGDRVERDIFPEIGLKPVDRVDAHEFGGLPLVADPSQQIPAAAADVKPAQAGFGTGGRDCAGHDFLHGGPC